MEQNKQPVAQYYYSQDEWARLGCGPLPEERDRSKIIDSHAKDNLVADGKAVKGHN